MSTTYRVYLPRPEDFQCPVCGGVLDYTASSDDYHRYECKCGAKLLIPKEEEK